MSWNLVINPGSTSTKLGVFDKDKPLFIETIVHSSNKISAAKGVLEQEAFRTEAIINCLDEHECSVDNISGVIAIGGLIKPGDSGVYIVNDDMLEDIRSAKYYEHAANLGAIIAHAIAKDKGIDAYIADAITVDELNPVAMFSGMPEIQRWGRSHTLNQKQMAKTAAKMLDIPYEKSKIVVAHMGGGISVAAHMNGRIIDVTSARGEGAFSIDRSGGINSYDLVRLCFSGKYEKEQMLGIVNGSGGVVSYLGTRDLREVEKRIEQGDTLASDVFDALCYQISKDIGAMCAALGERADCLVLTGGMANSSRLTMAINDRVSFLAKVLILPGENEMQALGEYLFDVQQGRIKPKEYYSEKE